MEERDSNLNFYFILFLFDSWGRGKLNSGCLCWRNQECQSYLLRLCNHVNFDCRRPPIDDLRYVFFHRIIIFF